jgi:RNA polymerase sigma-70 factor (ECF subfamily)
LVTAAIEQEIHALCVAGDAKGAVTRALEAYGPEVFGFLLRLSKSEDDASDAFGITCEDVWRNVAGFRWDSSFRTWLYVVAKNALRRQAAGAWQRRRSGLSAIPELSGIQQKVRTTTAAQFRSENRDRLRSLREKLDDDENALLVLRVDRGFEWDEIARILEPEGDRTRASARCRKRFERTTARLRKLAEEAGLLDGEP